MDAEDAKEANVGRNRRELQAKRARKRSLGQQLESNGQHREVALSCPQVLSQGGAELVGECSQDDQRTKAWKGLVKLNILYRPILPPRSSSSRRERCLHQK